MSRVLEVVTMPKFPPPPRRPQNRSGCSSGLESMTAPSAVTTRHERRLSRASPCLRMSQPIPPPSVRPPIPVWLTTPPVTASPNSWVARSTWPCRQPPSSPDRTVYRINASRCHDRQVDQQAVVDDSVSGDPVPAATDRGEQVRLAREADRLDDVGLACTSGDEAGSPVDVRVPDPPGVLIPLVAGLQDLAIQALSEIGDTPGHHHTLSAVCAAWVVSQRTETAAASNGHLGIDGSCRDPCGGRPDAH